MGLTVANLAGGSRGGQAIAMSIHEVAPGPDNAFGSKKPAGAPSPKTADSEPTSSSSSSTSSSTMAATTTTTTVADTTTTTVATTTTTDFLHRYAIGDRTWVDANHNGRQDPGEGPLARVTVALFLEGETTPVATTQSNSDGFYLFDNLPRSNYFLKFTAPDGYRHTVQSGAGVAADADSDQNADGLTGSFLLDETQDPDQPKNVTKGVPAGFVGSYGNYTIDAGFFAPLAIGDRVWADTNRNGVQDAGESGQAGITVALRTATGGPATAADGTAVPSVTTGADGVYHFDNLLPGTYQVAFSGLPEGSTFSPTGGQLPAAQAQKKATKAAGPSSAVDSDPDPATGLATVTLLGAGGGLTRTTEADGPLVATFVDRTVDAGVSPAAPPPPPPADMVDLGIDKSVLSKELGKGSVIKWKITVANNSNIAVANAKIVDTIADTVRPGAAGGNGWVCDFAGQVLNCLHAGDIPAGEDASVEVTGEVLLDNGDITNTATVSNPRGADAFPGNDSDTVTARVITEVLPHTGSRLWWPMAIIADLLSTLGIAMVIHDAYNRKRQALLGRPRLAAW